MRAAAPQPAQLSAAQASARFLADGKVHAWLERYPPHPGTQATLARGVWTVNLYSGAAGEVATGTVDATTGLVTSAWTGPQVAWTMARGIPGAFGGTRINSASIWLAFCAVFLLGLVDWRRPFSLRNADLVMLLSFSVSLWYFNQGNVFAAVPLAYPGLIWLLGRCLFVGISDRRSAGGVVWPTWVLVGLTVFLVGFRAGLNVRTGNVIDVGYSGIIGAYLIAHGESPYGNFPVEDGLRPCGPADASGEIRNRVQTNGRCETADASGDTYGSMAYEAYLPGYLVFGWSGLWDSLPAVHATTLLWDLVCIAGLVMVGRRFGDPKLGAVLAFAWAAWPFSQYASNSNSNDMIQPALLVWAFYFASSPFLRGSLNALSSLVKFAPLIALPLWAGYPDVRGLAGRLRFVCGFLIAAALSLSVLLFDPSLSNALHTFYDDTFSFQLSRSSPFSLWDWGQYHARGLPDLHWLQRVLEVALVAGALALGRWPARRSPLRLAAFTGALLVGFELVLTHWSYLYLPWFFPFVAFALIAWRSAEEPPPPSSDAASAGLLATA